MPETLDPFRLLLEGIDDYALFLLDAQGRINRCSSSVRDMFYYAADEVVGREFSSIYKSLRGDSPVAHEELEMAAAHGRFEDAGWRTRRDDTQFWADCVICPIRDDAGTLQGFSLIVRDLTDRKETEEILRQREEELAQARKMEAVGRLAGGVAHDFSNFITGIRGVAEEMRQSMSELDPRRADLDEIIRTSDQAQALTRELLAFGRRQVSAPQVINLNVLLKEKEKLLTRLLGADIQLQIDLDPAARNILIDPTQLDQILINLVMNARDAMPRGGSIRMETRRTLTGTAHADRADNPQVELAIKDSGQGIDAATLAHIFEPFFTTKEKGKGTGMGLATVYGIVKQNYGHISVQSQSGEGTTFIIQFPEIDSPAQTLASAPLSTPATGSETVLVAEDTRVVQRVVTRMLEKGGYRVLSASSGKQALELLHDHPDPVHLLLTDVIMPGLSGPQLAERVRASRAETAVLYMSAYAEDLIQARGAAGEDLSFIQKPFTNASLLHKVREVLDQKTASVGNAP